MENHPNWFDASYISWLSYDSLNIELPMSIDYWKKSLLHFVKIKNSCIRTGSCHKLLKSND